MLQRPSLETISHHPFFTHDTKKIPKSLPSCCTHVAPDWQEDDQGQLVPVLAESEENVQRAKVPSRRREEPSNGRYAQYVDNRQRPNEMRREEHHKRSGQAEKFEIYDDKDHRQHEQFDSGRRQGNYRSRDSGRHQKIEDDQIVLEDPDVPHRITNSSNKGFDEVTKKLAACDIQGSDEKMANENFTGSPDSDMNALEKMLSRINGAFSHTGAPLNFKPISHSQLPGAQKWVTRYVDYTSKYGLGFLLNDKR